MKGQTLCEIFSKEARIKWKAGDLFFKPQWPTRIYRIKRVHGTQIFYLGNEYGDNPPRGMIREVHAAETVSWVKVERCFRCCGDKKIMMATGDPLHPLRAVKCSCCSTVSNG